MVDNDEIISDDAKIAERFNCFFENAVTNLKISDNVFLINKTENEISRINKAITKFEIHPSIKSINENVTLDSRFSFSKVGINEIRLEIKALNNKKKWNIYEYSY